MKGFIDNQNAGLVCIRIIPSSGSRCNRCVGERLNGFVKSMHVDLFGCVLKNCEIIAETACVCIRISFIGVSVPSLSMDGLDEFKFANQADESIALILCHSVQPPSFHLSCKFRPPMIDEVKPGGAAFC